MKNDRIKYRLTTLLLALCALRPLAAQEDSPAQEDSLAHYLALAAANNPAIAAARLEAEAALQKLPQAGAYADPTLETGVFLSPMELPEGRQVAQIQVMQMFPWFGVRKAARSEAQRMAGMSAEQLREVRDGVLLDVYTQWYALAALRRQLDGSLDHLRRLDELERLALRRFASGSSAPAPARNPAARSDVPAPGPATASGGMQMSGGATRPAPAASGAMTPMDVAMPQAMNPAGAGMTAVLNIQLEKMELESRIEGLRDAIEAGKARFNALLGRPAAGALALADTLVALPFFADAGSLATDISERNPQLAMLREESLAYGDRAEMQRRMSYPMWGLGLQYMLIAPRSDGGGAQPMDAMTAGAPAMNGKDMLMPMLSVSIPLYRNKYKAAQRETRLLREAADARRAAAAARLDAEMRRLLAALADDARRIDLYRRQADLTRAAARLSEQEFISGKAPLDDLIQAERRLLDYRLKEADALASHNTTVAALLRLAALLPDAPTTAGDNSNNL
jgi:outer membrane protein TolC